MELTNDKLIDVFEMLVERMNNIEATQDRMVEHLRYAQRTKYGDIKPLLFSWGDLKLVQRLRWDATTCTHASNDVTVPFETQRMLVDIKSPEVIGWRKYANMLLDGKYDPLIHNHRIDLEKWKDIERKNLATEEDPKEEWVWADPEQLNIPKDEYEDASEWFYAQVLAHAGKALGLEITRLQPTCDVDKTQMWLKHSVPLTVDEWVKLTINLMKSIDAPPTSLILYDVHPEVPDTFLHPQPGKCVIAEWLNGLNCCTRVWTLNRAIKEDWLILFGFDADDLKLACPETPPGHEHLNE